VGEVEVCVLDEPAVELLLEVELVGEARFRLEALLRGAVEEVRVDVRGDRGGPRVPE